jgi:hypothetical protein
MAGHSQTFLFIGYTAAAWMLLLLPLRWRSLARRDRGRLVLGLLAGALLAGGLSAAQLLPSVEFAGLSVRASVDYNYVAGGFPLQDTWQLLLPGVLTQYSPLYIGVIGLGLGGFGALVALRGLSTARGVAGEMSVQPMTPPHRPWSPPLRAGAGFFLGLAFVALLLSYGGNGFLYPLFYWLAPGWNLFRGQERAAYLVALGLSALAGYGALAVLTLPARVRGWWATVFAAAAIAGSYAFGLLWQLPGRTAISQAHFLLLAALTVGLASAFAVLLRMEGWSRRRSLWLAGLALANLFAANFGANLGDFSPARRTLLAPEVAAVQAAVAEAAVEDGQAGAAPGRVYNEFRAYEDYAMRIGVEDVWGASPLRLARYAALFEDFPLDRMWQLLGVEHVLTWREELFGPSTLLAEFPQATDTTYLHRLPQPQPRAWLVQQARAVSDDEAVLLLADHQFDLNAAALLAEDAPAPAATAATTALTAAVQLEMVAPGHLRLTLADSPGGLLVVSENWMPGWRVERPSSGAQASASTQQPVSAQQPVRANLTLIGVPVPPGPYTFELVYQPDSIRLGLLISGATLLLLIVAAGGRLLSRRRVAP